MKLYTLNKEAKCYMNNNANIKWRWKDVIKSNNLSKRAKHFGLVLVDYCNSKTGLCCPSYSAIKADWGISKDTSIRALKDLQHVGLIEVEKKYQGQHHYNSYIFKIPNLEYLEAYLSGSHNGYRESHCAETGSLNVDHNISTNYEKELFNEDFINTEKTNNKFYVANPDDEDEFE